MSRLSILILEDDADRRTAMARVLRDRFPQFRHVFHTSSNGTIEFLSTHFDEVIALCLDHDLELIPTEDGKFVDAGTGRDVADHLASRPPSFPVIIHTTNAPAAEGMLAALGDADWTTHRVVPYGDLEWIDEVWSRCVRDAIVADVGRAATTTPRNLILRPYE